MFFQCLIIYGNELEKVFSISVFYGHKKNKIIYYYMIF